MRALTLPALPGLNAHIERSRGCVFAALTLAPGYLLGAPSARGKQCSRFSGVQGNRLFAKNVLPCLGGFDRQRNMEVIGERIVNNLG